MAIGEKKPVVGFSPPLFRIVFKTNAWPESTKYWISMQNLAAACHKFARI